MQIVAPQKEVQEEKVQKEIKSGKYGWTNKIHVRIYNNEIKTSEEVSSKGNFKFTNSI